MMFFRIRSPDFINLKVLIIYIWYFKRTRMEKYVAFKMALAVVLPKPKKKKISLGNFYLAYKVAG